MAEARREVETGNVFPLGKTCRAIIAKQCPGIRKGVRGVLRRRCGSGHYVCRPTSLDTLPYPLSNSLTS
jgi:hypothetical protein